MAFDQRELIPGTSELSNAELDEKLEEAAVLHARMEKLICCYLTEVRERGAFRDFGYASIYDYAYERFGFKQRKTRYLIALGAKLKRLPQLRDALVSGKIGWCKATRIAAVATAEDEAMWLDSALSISVQELDRRIRNETESLAGPVHLWFTQDQRIVWENAIEVCRRVAGADISPSQAAEYLAAEFLATWSARSPGEAEPVDEVERDPAPLFVSDTEPSIPAPDRSWPEIRNFVLERDGWKCTYPGCNSRCELDAHHVEYRSRGGSDEPWCLTSLCRFHHALLHTGVIGVSGRAPFELVWTPPRLMREILERRRNNRSVFVGELDIREWPSGNEAKAAYDLPEEAAHMCRDLPWVPASDGLRFAPHDPLVALRIGGAFGR